MLHFLVLESNVVDFIRPKGRSDLGFLARTEARGGPQLALSEPWQTFHEDVASPCLLQVQEA